GAGAAAAVPSFEPIDCPRFVTAGRVEDGFDAPVDLTCGYLHVLEDRDDPAKGTIRLFVTVATPSGGSAFPDPVINLGRELYWASAPSRQALGPTGSGRVLVTLDPRGAGYSQPNLRCPEVKKLTSPSFGVTLGSPQMEDALVDAVGACHGRLVGDGVDLASFNIAGMAADGEGLRVALGFDWGAR